MTRISPSIRGADQQRLNTIQRNTDRTQTSLERLTTGKRINRPKDDPAGFVATEELRQELGDLKQQLGGLATERTELRTRESGLANIQSALADLRGRIVSAADGSLTADQRAALEDEINETVDAATRIANITGSNLAINIALGDSSAGEDAITTAGVDAASDSVTGERVALATHERTQIDPFRAIYQDQIAITSEALSQIEDTDFAAESTNLAQSQTLTQGALAALAYAGREQANQLALLLDSIA